MCVLQRISYSLLVAFCYRDLPPPDRAGLACQITEPASASGGRAARQVPASRQVCHIGAGLPRGEIGLFPTRGKAATRSVSSPTADRDSYPYGEVRPDRDPDAAPTAQEFTSWPALTSMRPGHRPFRAPLPDCRWPQFSPVGQTFRGPAPARQPRTYRQSSQK